MEDVSNIGQPEIRWLNNGKHPLVALDLPLKIIAFQDAELKVWIAYNEAAYIESRYLLEADSLSVLSLDQLVERIIH